jgi:hypothetical protein
MATISSRPGVSSAEAELVTTSGALDVGGLASAAAGHPGLAWTAATMASVASRPRPDHRVHTGVDHAHSLGSQPVLAPRRLTDPTLRPAGRTPSCTGRATHVTAGRRGQGDYHGSELRSAGRPASPTDRHLSTASQRAAPHPVGCRGARDLPHVAALPARPRSVGMGLACRAAASCMSCAVLGFTPPQVDPMGPGASFGPCHWLSYSSWRRSHSCQPSPSSRPLGTRSRIG